MTVLKTKIQNALVDKAGKFLNWYRVIYSTGIASVDEGIAVTPSTVLANEVGTTFGPDQKYGRGLRRERKEWTFSLIVEFDQGEIWLEGFEDSVINPFVLAPAAVDGSYSQAIAWLSRTVVSHPPQQGASTGTKATFTFTIQVTRN